jgi:hypothetical protein
MAVHRASVAIVLVEGNLLRARKTAGQQLAGGHRLRVRLLSGDGKSLHRAKNFGHPLRIIGEENGNLGANDLLAGTSPNGPLLTGNRATPSFQHKLIQVLAPHELHDLLTQRKLASAKVFQLGLEETRLVV